MLDGRFAGLAERLQTNVTLPTLRSMRTAVGRELANFSYAETGLDRTQLKTVYRALSRDIELAYQDLANRAHIATRAGHNQANRIGPEAARAADRALYEFRRADRFFRQGIDRMDSFLSVVKADNPEVAARRLTQAALSDGKGDIAMFRNAMAGLRSEERSDFASLIVRQMGAPQASARGIAQEVGFSPNSFATNFQKLDPRARELLFPGEHGRAINDLFRVANRLANVEKFENVSGSGRMQVNVGGALAGMTSVAVGDVLTPLMVGSGGFGLAYLLSRPSLARWSAGYLDLRVRAASAADRASRSQLAAHLNKLGQMAQRDPELGEVYRSLAAENGVIEGQDDKGDPERGVRVQDGKQGAESQRGIPRHAQVGSTGQTPFAPDNSHSASLEQLFALLDGGQPQAGAATAETPSAGPGVDEGQLQQLVGTLQGTELPPGQSRYSGREKRLRERLTPVINRPGEPQAEVRSYTPSPSENLDFNLRQLLETLGMPASQAERAGSGAAAVASTLLPIDDMHDISRSVEEGDTGATAAAASLAALGFLPGFRGAKKVTQEAVDRMQREVEILQDQLAKLGGRSGPRPAIFEPLEQQAKDLEAMKADLASRIEQRRNINMAAAPTTSVPKTSSPDMRELMRVLDSNPSVQAIPGRQGFPTKAEQQRLAREFFQGGGQLPAAPWGRNALEDVRYALSEAHAKGKKISAEAREAATDAAVKADGAAKDLEQLRLLASVAEDRGQRVLDLKAQLGEAEKRAAHYQDELQKLLQLLENKGG